MDTASRVHVPARGVAAETGDKPALSATSGPTQGSSISQADSPNKQASGPMGASQPTRQSPPHQAQSTRPASKVNSGTGEAPAIDLASKESSQDIIHLSTALATSNASNTTSACAHPEQVVDEAGLQSSGSGCSRKHPALLCTKGKCCQVPAIKTVTRVQHQVCKARRGSGRVGRARRFSAADAGCWGARMSHFKGKPAPAGTRISRPFDCQSSEQQVRPGLLLVHASGLTPKSQPHRKNFQQEDE